VSAPPPVPVALTFRSPGAFLVAYATNMVKGGLFVETASPLAAGTPVTLRLSAPARPAVTVDGVVDWTRAAAAGPGQPAGMSVTIAALPEALGEAVDAMAFGLGRIQVLMGVGEAAPRAILARYLRSILTCEIVEVEDPAASESVAGGLDLAVIDLDSSGAAGFDLLARLRAHAATASAPALALAHLERDRARALRAGFDEALANPPVFAELQAAALRCLARPVTVA
jgi:uncharacterized protein (TIGR02266 family)